jgi:excisionase family DNA binding protein
MIASHRDLSVSAVARICRVSPDTIRRWCDSGRLRAGRLPGSEQRRISLEALHEFVAANPRLGIDPARLPQPSPN